MASCSAICEGGNENFCNGKIRLDTVGQGTGGVGSGRGASYLSCQGRVQRISAIRARHSERLRFK
jgi:hypothetical protein